jgi:hypothetical protein
VTAASMERAWRPAAIPENGTSNQSHAAVPVPNTRTSSAEMQARPGQASYTSPIPE